MSEILYPEDETALAAALREANGPLQIMGGGTRPIGRIAPAQEPQQVLLELLLLLQCL